MNNKLNVLDAVTTHRMPVWRWSTQPHTFVCSIEFIEKNYSIKWNMNAPLSYYVLLQRNSASKTKCECEKKKTRNNREIKDSAKFIRKKKKIKRSCM